jgi:ubiquinol-cytochrome c reductase cytochrome b subunit
MANFLIRTATDAANGAMEWVNQRAPGMMPFYRKHMSEYYAPKNFNFWYSSASLAMLVLVNQIVTGIFLTMHFKPSAAEAFASVEYIMRDVEWGWLIRYMHSTGASLFFVVVYLHMFRGLIYGSYQKPRELVWMLGMLIYLVLMAEAFFGYVLPWGQMSYWGAQGDHLPVRRVPGHRHRPDRMDHGDYNPGDATLNRFFALHVIALPLVLLLLVVLHLFALHEVGSNNPDGVDIKKVKGKETGADRARTACLPPVLHGQGHCSTSASSWSSRRSSSSTRRVRRLVPGARQLHRGEPLVTPAHIKPVWYFTPYYAMLRVVPSFFGIKLWGVLVMFGAIAVLFLVPWLDKSPVKSYRYRGWLSWGMLLMFAVCFLWLGKIGAGPGTDPTETIIGRVLTFLYFAFFITMPVWTKLDKTKPVPERVTMHD